MTRYDIRVEPDTRGRTETPSGKMAGRTIPGVVGIEKDGTVINGCHVASHHFDGHPRVSPRSGCWRTGSAPKNRLVTASGGRA